MELDLAKLILAGKSDFVTSCVETIILGNQREMEAAAQAGRALIPTGSTPEGREVQFLLISFSYLQVAQQVSDPRSKLWTYALALEASYRSKTPSQSEDCFASLMQDSPRPDPTVVDYFKEKYNLQ
ncbi:hypothetical protein HZB02_03710 [Candidatus Woesearchaeota archaeon]|nr:hypothetical protein [Candidatus Woesearchaeota archaeon]